MPWPGLGTDQANMVYLASTGTLAASAFHTRLTAAGTWTTPFQIPGTASLNLQFVDITTSPAYP